MLPLILLSVFAGTMIVLQAPINAQLGNIMGGPVVAAFFSFFTGTIVLGAILLIARKPILVENVTQTAPWMWFGGTMGAVMVFTSIFVVPKLGAAGMIACVIFGQIIFSLIVDHYGILLPERTPLSLVRVLGVVLLLVGVVLIMSPKL